MKAEGLDVDKAFQYINSQDIYTDSVGLSFSSTCSPKEIVILDHDISH